jgi:hypothetical protein
MLEPDHVAAHGHSANHREDITRSEQCGCFYCLAIFAPSQITEWADTDSEGIGRTALCPKCGIDSVIGSASGIPITGEFLDKMRRHWFNQ